MIYNKVSERVQKCKSARVCKFFAVILIAFMASSCGIKGKLYLPDEKQMTTTRPTDGPL